MNVKKKLGIGMEKKKPISKKKNPLAKQKKKPIPFRKIVNAAKKAIRRSSDAKVAINSALRGAQEAVKSVGEVKNPRILPIPFKVGGVLPLIPIFGYQDYGSVECGYLCLKFLCGQLHTKDKYCLYKKV